MSRSKVDTLLAKLAETRDSLDLVMPFLPLDLHDMLRSDQLAIDCRRQFVALDVSEPKGKLRPQDLVPVIVQLSEARQQSVGADQVERFAKMFDANGDGWICLDEFTQLVQFVMITAFLESEEGREVVEKARLEDKNIDDFIGMIQQDREKLWDIVPFLPPWLVDHVTSDTFFSECHAHFDKLDVDESGALEPEELLPVVLTLTEAHHFSVNIEKCKAFVKVFDVHENGVIQKDEFIEFAQFLTIMSFLSNSAEGQAVHRQVALADDGRCIASTLKVLEFDPSRTTDAFHYLPRALVEEISDEVFFEVCRKGFQRLDANNNGVLEHQELYPIVIQICEPHPFGATEAQCKEFSKFFDVDQSGVLSLHNFVLFARYVMVMSYLNYAQEHQEMMLAEMVIGKARIDELLAALREHTTNIDEIVPFLPQHLVEDVLSQAFEERCLQEFRALDGDSSGMLDEFELIPLILNLAAAHRCALTMEHARRFVELFDPDHKGALTRREYVEFARFMLIMAYLNTEEGQDCSKHAIREAECGRFEDLLQMLREDRRAIHKVFPVLPMNVAESLLDADFAIQCHDAFRKVDVDNRGRLKPSELCRIVVDLSKAHPFSVTDSQCRRFSQVFDSRGHGVINSDEFLDFARFVCVLGFLDSADGELKVRDALQIASDSRTVDELLAMLRADRRQLPKVMPFLPQELRDEMFGEQFALDCRAHFAQLDTNGNGSLDPDELFTVVQAMSQAHRLALDRDQCVRFAAIFDDACTGSISKAEFVDFTHFLMVMSWLNSDGGRHVLHAAREEPCSPVPGNSKTHFSLSEAAAASPATCSPGVATSLGFSASSMRDRSVTSPVVSPEVGHLVVDAEFYETKASKLSGENDELRSQVFGLQSENRKLAVRLEDLENRLRHADLDLRASQQSL